MPQGGKKTPFSGKLKKAQLQAKRERKAGGGGYLGKYSGNASSGGAGAGGGEGDGEEQDVGQGSHFTDVELQTNRDKKTRYKLQFQKESKKELAESRERAHNPIERVNDLSAPSELFFDESVHDFPQRPQWKEGWSKERLEQSEQKYFREYCQAKLQLEGISYFELNIETWRQFWRVIEMSDVLLLILDIRFATATFPPALYHHVVSLGKTLVLVLNKIDLVEPELSAAWKDYLQAKYPKMKIVFFTSYPAYSLVNRTVNKAGLQFRKLKANFGIAKEGALQVLEVCQEVTELDLTDWKARIEGKGVEVLPEEEEKKVLTVGTLGHPNVGKSSLINSLLGKIQVSVSRTPGHTKHFQTIFLTRNVRLCDCPGLVFPSMAPRPLQILMGSFPISQVREPYSVVQFLAERLNIPPLLGLPVHPPDDQESEWSAFGLCSEWAEARGYTTARTSRPDTYRAANQVLRFALEGRLSLALEPPDYNQENFVDHPDTVLVREVLGRRPEDEEPEEDEGVEDESESEDDMEEESGDEDSVEGGTKGGTLNTQNPFAVLDDSS